MDLDNDNVRALSRSLQNLSLSIEPPPRKHRRKKPATSKRTFVTTAVVPAADSTEILSSLISSLTVLSDSVRDPFHEVTTLQDESDVEKPHELPDDPFISTFAAAQEQDEMLVTRAPHDNDIAEFPVVGYARGRPNTPNKPKAKWTIHRSKCDRSASEQQPATNIVHIPSNGGASIGMPSIERPSTSATNRSPKENTISLDQAVKNSFKTLFASRSSEDQRDLLMFQRDEVRPGSRANRSRTNSTVTNRSRQHSSAKKNSRPTVTDVFASPPSRPRTSPEASPSSSSSPETSRHNPLSPANREELGEHLIPSRSSSMRHSPDKARRSRPSIHRQTSNESDTTAPIIEAVALEEEDPTTRRIRELQMAKERRQNEWAAESNRSDRKPKQLALSESIEQQETIPRSATQLMLSTATQHDTILPQSSILNDLNRGKTATPVGRIPYLPTIRPATPTSPSVSLLGTNGVQVAALPSPSGHKRGLSASIRRSSSIRKQTSDETKRISEQVDAFLSAPRLSRRLRHPRTNRTIAFSEVGDPDGFTVFVCVGMGLTRYITSFYDEVARTEKLRLITPDRPGIGGSSAFTGANSTPLAWVDDIAVICQSLKIERFSLLAHSAGAIYALAIALKMPQYVCGKIHLLAPWIPASQMSTRGTKEVKTANLPTAHRLLSMLPAPILRAANSRFLSATSASFDTKSSRIGDRPASSLSHVPYISKSSKLPIASTSTNPAALQDGRASSVSAYASSPLQTSTVPTDRFSTYYSPPTTTSPSSTRNLSSPTPIDPIDNTNQQTSAALYNKLLTTRTRILAETDSNPAVDLVVCLEKRGPIGFKYTDVVRVTHKAIVITHGRLDDRVPLANIRWLQDVMSSARGSGSGSCELRVLDNEAHGLMGSAKVIAGVLEEMGRDAVAILNDVKKQETARLQQQMNEKNNHGGREKKDRRRQAVVGVKELVERSDRDERRDRDSRIMMGESTEEKFLREQQKSWRASLLY